MPRAFVMDEKGNEITIAQSDKTLRIEGNYYFPPDSVNSELFVESDSHTTCPWKGLASYKSVKAGEKEYSDGAWYYPVVSEGAKDRVGKDFSNYYAFWRGVEVED